MSEKYEAPHAEVVKFNNEDIICTSGCNGSYRVGSGLDVKWLDNK